MTELSPLAWLYELKPDRRILKNHLEVGMLDRRVFKWNRFPRFKVWKVQGVLASFSGFSATARVLSGLTVKSHYMSSTNWRRPSKFWSMMEIFCVSPFFSSYLPILLLPSSHSSHPHAFGICPYTTTSTKTTEVSAMFK